MFPFYILPKFGFFWTFFFEFKISSSFFYKKVTFPSCVAYTPFSVSPVKCYPPRSVVFSILSVQLYHFGACKRETP